MERRGVRISDLDVVVATDKLDGLLDLTIRTDDGSAGHAQTALPSRPAALLAILDSFKSHPLIGSDATQPARVQQILAALEPPTESSAAATAIGLVEAACWDLTAKRLALPLRHLLGGAIREAVPACAVDWEPADRNPDHFAAAAQEVVAQGYRIVKYAPFSHFVPGNHIPKTEAIRALRSCEMLRAAFGPDVSLWLSFGGLFNAPDALRLVKAVKRVEPAGILDPLTPDANDQIGALARRVGVPLAVSQRVNQWPMLRNQIAEGAVGLVSADPVAAGGITATRTLATLASANGISFALRASGGEVTLRLAAELALALPGVRFVETPVRTHSARVDTQPPALNPLMFLLGNISEPSHSVSRPSV